jgi:GntR family transcriptional regulator/MocR family aminotransferase
MDRGVRCTADRVVIVNSTQQAIDLAARLLLDPGDAVWLEDPGYVAARRAFVAAGARTVAVPVDSEGIDVAAGTALATDARLAYVTPSHQYPLGMTLSLARRLELIAWAARSEAWILEDDYDSELRYDGQPLASIQGIDEFGRVIYVGTFNKILFPGVRAAYLVLPQVLVEPFTRAKALADGFTSPFVQGVLADFIGEGHFAVHLRRVRELYRERRDAFRRAAVDHLPPDAVLGPAEAGIHVALHLPDGVDDRRLSERALREGLALPALSAQSIERTVRGLLVHYGHVAVPELDSATRRLAGVLERARRPGRSQLTADTP